MMILEVCPECGADIQHLEICTYPPIPVVQCTKCSWRWEGKPERTIRVPFNPLFPDQGLPESSRPTEIGYPDHMRIEDGRRAESLNNKGGNALPTD